MKLKFAFAGFRHGHIFGLLQKIQQHSDCEIIACCEEDAATRNAWNQPDVKITHDNIDRMLAEVDCDVVAVGDYYGKRGSILIRALEAGKHVIADKPICTSLSELETITTLVSQNNLKVGCMLDLRQNSNLEQARLLIRAGEIGNIHAVSFGGQHPLLWGSRPNWYFEEGKHGGTINDIAIHGIDAIEWITGLSFASVNAARSWNALATECPSFKDGAQFMLSMNNGCGVLGDVSYFAPDSCGYSLPYYWDFIFWGDKGVIHTNISSNEIEVTVNGNKELRRVAGASALQPDYCSDFINDIVGKAVELNTEVVLNVARKTLKIQQAADQGLNNIPL